MNQTPSSPKLFSPIRERLQAQPVYPYSLLSYSMDNPGKWEHKTSAMQPRALHLEIWGRHWKHHSGLSRKNTSASSTASGYGLPFNSHSETTNILCNKQIQLAWIEIHAVLLPNFLQPCCSIQWLGSRDKSSPLPSAEQYTLECLMVFAESFHQQMCNICLSYSANFILEFASSCPPQNHVNPKRKTLKS